MQTKVLKTILITLLFLQLKGSYSQNELDSVDYYLERSEYDISALFYQKWLENNPPGTEKYTDVIMSYAINLKLQNNYAESMRLYLEIKNGRYGDLNRRQELSLAVGLGELYRAVEKIDLSLKELKRVNISQADLRKYPEKCSQIFHRLAAAFNQKGILDSAVYYSHRSMALSKKYGYDNHMSINFNEIANIFEKNQMMDSAIYYYDQACHFWKEKGDKRLFSNAYFNRARVAFHEGKVDSALYMFLDNLEFIKDKDWPGVKGPIYHYLTQIYYSKGDSLNGLKYENENLRSSISDQRKRQDRDLLELEAKYKTKEKDRELRYHQREIEQKEQEIDERNERLFFLFMSLLLAVVMILMVAVFAIRFRSSNTHLRKLLKENQFLLAESNHRIKNNLQLITSLIMQETDKYSGNDRKILLELSNKIEAISMLHKQIYLEESKDEIDLKTYFLGIKENYETFCKEQNVACELDMEEISIGIDKSLYLGLLLSELISNSLKHAFENTEHPMIKLQTAEENEKVKLIYSDNGSGLKGETPTLVELMCLQLKGKFSMECEEGFKLTLTIKK